MKNPWLLCALATGLAFSGGLPLAEAQDPTPPYLNIGLSAEARAADLVGRLTLEEKASQLVNQSRAIPRLNVPAYDWWSEALHGVALDGSTEFPEPIGLGATFDPEGIRAMAEVIGVEGRIRHAQALKDGHSNIFEGLDFWAPNVNIFRDPRWGRGQETYGEDPFLSGRLAVAYVTGMQGDDPQYYRAISTPKHFAVHSGPEPTRHTADVPVTKHDELDTYLPAFRAAITEGKAASIMCAYNSVNGQPACANEFLLQNQLRGKWGFKGYVVSDCGAVVNIFDSHHYKSSQAEASATSLKAGMDNECADFMTKVTDNHDYKPYLDAVQKGFLKESEIDTALKRLFTARMKLGMFDPPQMVKYNNIDEALLDSTDHRKLALKLANESMVLLKNEGALPIEPTIKNIAVIGPLAIQTQVLLGNYTGKPSRTTSIMQAMQDEFRDATIHYATGTQFLSEDASPVPAALLTTNGKPGVKASYTEMDFTDEHASDAPAPRATRIEQGIMTNGSEIPSEAAEVRPITVRWEATLTVPDSGEYQLGMDADGAFRISVDGKEVISVGNTNGVERKLGHVQLEKGHGYKLLVEYCQHQDSDVSARLVWSKYDLTPSAKAIATASAADVIVAVVGLTSGLENVEMQVHEDGFSGGDRTSMDLPKPEQDLLEALEATHKPLVVVLLNGSPLSVNWAKEHANAILEAWYPGEEGGRAVAQTLSGRNNPAGRLPVNFYTGVDQLPPFDDYSMKGRTYRYFTGLPLFHFGYGLSYTTFTYKLLTIPTAPILAGSPLAAEVKLANTGHRVGDEVVQVYLTFPAVPGAPIRALRGFKRVHLEAGEETTLHFLLSPRDMSIVNNDGEIVVAPGKYTIWVGGARPGIGVPMLSKFFTVKGDLRLEE